MTKTLNEKNLPEFCGKLAAADQDLNDIFRAHGTPPLWKREANFATLVHIILEQQVSLASALSAFNKLQEKIGAITPENVLRLSDEEFKACYFSRQKTSYTRNLANAVSSGELDLENLQKLSDEQVRTELIKLKGIGRWTADIFLLMALMRLDVMPRGDLALHVAWKKLKKLERAPDSDEFQIIAERWQPFRAVAARLLWHYYLNCK